MNKSWKERRGRTPGSYSGKSEFSIICMDFNETDLTEKSLDLKQLSLMKPPQSGMKRVILFMDFINQDLMDVIRNKYSIHSLTLEDIVHTDQRSKYESYQGYDLFILAERWRLVSTYYKEQVSIISTSDTVMVFLEHKIDPNSSIDERGKKEIKNVDDIRYSVEYVISRIRKGSGRVRQRDIGYLTYALLDSIIDSQFVVVEELEKELKSLDILVENSHDKQLARKIFELKRDVIEFKKESWPAREMMNSIIRNEDSFLFNDERNKLYFRDLQDHVFRITETMDSLRDSTYSLVEMHMNMVGMKMNEIMKFLTIITTIFTPVMFMASIYGMNFEYIPELHFSHGYEIFWGFALVSTVVQVYFFRKKGWI